MRYLDPKADLTFKKVFGEHPDVVMSFLNALLPLPQEEEVTEIEYLPAELVPENPLRKDSIVDVRCRDKKGRQFIVEMQMVWSPEFRQRVLFNSSKAYVRQMDKGENYHLLQPVYSLNLVNDIFEPELPAEYFHYYRMVHVEHTDRVIEGLHLVFVELPKFKPQSYAGKKMQVLWLRYLTEVGEHTAEISPDLLEQPEIRKAVTFIEESAFTDAQLLGYEKFWDTVSIQKTLYSSGERKGKAEGLEEGKAEGLEEGMKKGLEEGMKKGRSEGMEEGMEKGVRKQQIQTALGMKNDGMSLAAIAKYTGLSMEEIERL